MIDYEVMDPNRKYSKNLPQGGLEIPCVLTLRGTKDLVDKAVKLLAIGIFRNLHVITKIWSHMICHCKTTLSI